MLIFIAIMVSIVALTDLVILANVAGVTKIVERMMAQLMYVTTLLQAVDHKVSKASGVMDGDEEYLEEIVREHSDYIGE